MAEAEKRDFAQLMVEGNSAPYYQLIGMRIVELGEGWARLVMPVEKKLYHSGRFVQGGAIVSLADEATAYALFTLLSPNENLTTVELKLNFLRPVDNGELTAFGRVVQKGRTIAVADVEVHKDDGKMVARGMTTMMIVRNG